eukprot:5021654-Ditylum_brightwellii.AAC.1
MHPYSQPAVGLSLVGIQLDICNIYDLNDGSDGSQLHWSQGVIYVVSDGKSIVQIGKCTAYYKTGKVVMICWDANPARNEVTTELTQLLQLRKFNPLVHSNGSWRLDIDVELYRQDTGVMSE